MMIRIKRTRHRNSRKTNWILRVVCIPVLMITVSLLLSCMPPGSSTPSVSPTVTTLPSSTSVPETPTITPEPTSTSLTFVTEADARVEESEPNENFGNSERLRVDNGDDPDIESFIRFTVIGVSDTVRNAQLRVYATDNSTNNGPAVYSTDALWAEAEITWNTRPARTSDAVDNKDHIDTETWVAYDVTSLVTGNGTFSFLLAGDSSNSVVLSSREGSHPPQLVITLGSVPTPTSSPTLPAGAVTFVGAGDISTCSNDNDESTARLLDAIPGTIFTTGDNVYSSGTISQYTNCYNPTWGRHKARTMPVPGNHEYQTSGAAGYFQYFNNISSYYAYELGSWRIYALNSEIDVSAGSPQVAWLLADLAANPRQCVLAYWHQPRWSSGRNHSSDSNYQTLWQILYAAGAEVVLNGHEHNYERFAPMNADGEADPLGLREFVVGTGGRSFYGFDTPLPASEVRNSDTYGVLKLTLRETGYDWEFVPVAGSTFTDSGSTNCH